MDNPTDNFCTFENMEVKFYKLNKLFNQKHKQLKDRVRFSDADLDVFYQINAYLTKFEEKLTHFASLRTLDREEVLSIMSMQKINQSLLEKCAKDIYKIKSNLKTQQEKGV